MALHNPEEDAKAARRQIAKQRPTTTRPKTPKGNSPVKMFLNGVAERARKLRF